MLTVQLGYNLVILHCQIDFLKVIVQERCERSNCGGIS